MPGVCIATLLYQVAKNENIQLGTKEVFYIGI